MLRHLVVLCGKVKRHWNGRRPSYVNCLHFFACCNILPVNWCSVNLSCSPAYSPSSNLCGIKLKSTSLHHATKPLREKPKRSPMYTEQIHKKKKNNIHALHDKEKCWWPPCVWINELFLQGLLTLLPSWPSQGYLDAVLVTGRWAAGLYVRGAQYRWCKSLITPENTGLEGGGGGRGDAGQVHHGLITCWTCYL